jgi:hypothetical protein
LRISVLPIERDRVARDADAELVFVLAMPSHAGQREDGLLSSSSARATFRRRPLRTLLVNGELEWLSRRLRNS